MFINLSVVVPKQSVNCPKKGKNRQKIPYFNVFGHLDKLKNAIWSQYLIASLNISCHIFSEHFNNNVTFLVGQLSHKREKQAENPIF